MPWYLKPWVRFSAAIPLAIGAYLLASIITVVGLLIVRYVLLGLLHMRFLETPIEWIGVVVLSTKPVAQSITVASLVGYERPVAFASIMAVIFIIVFTGTEIGSRMLKMPMTGAAEASLVLGSLTAAWRALLIGTLARSPDI